MRAFLILCLLAAAPASWADEVKASLLVYRVAEEGTDPYISRILVTPKALRMDEGAEGVAYTLLDRESGVIYNVDDELRSVLVVKPPAQKPAPPIPLEIEESSQPSGSGPVNGIQPNAWKLIANGRTCVTVEALPGLMQDATTAVADLYDRLGFVHGGMLSQTPPEFLNACDLAQNVYRPRAQWSQGMPLSVAADRIQLELVDHEPSFDVAGSLFVVPDDYRTMDMPTPSPDA